MISKTTHFGIVLIFIFIGFRSVFGQQYDFQYNGKDYAVVMFKTTWANAADYAVQQEAHLVEINDEGEQNAVYDAIVNGAFVPSTYVTVNDGGGIAYVWIGGTDKNFEGTWLWDGNNDDQGVNFWTGQGSAGFGNGKAIDGAYVNWGGAGAGAYNEPDNYNQNQNAAAIGLAEWPNGSGGLGEAGEWNDININNSHYFVIEYIEKLDTPELEYPADEAVDIQIQPEFKWSDIEADNYKLQVSATEDFDGELVINKDLITTNSYTPETALNNGTMYYWRVMGYNDEMDSKWSEASSFTTIELPTPDAPTLVSPENGAEDVNAKPVMIWNTVENVTYSIEVSETSDFAEITASHSELMDTAFVPEEILDFGVSYYWRVNASRGDKSSEWSEVWSFTTDANIPATPNLVSPENGAVDADLQPVFKFSLIENALSYQLIVSKNEDLSSPVVDASFYYGQSIDTVKIEKVLDEKTVYYWAMKASNNQGESDLSPVWSFTTKESQSVLDESGNELLMVYPNPAGGHFYVEGPFGEMKNISAKLMALDGREINAEFERSGDKILINTDNLIDGVYYIIISADGRQFVKKLTVVR